MQSSQAELLEGLSFSPAFLHHFRGDDAPLAHWAPTPTSSVVRPAVYLSVERHGAFVGLLPRAADTDALAQLLSCLLLELAPEVLGADLPTSHAELGPVGFNGSLEALNQALTGDPLREDSRRYAAQAEEKLAQVGPLLAAGEVAAARTQAQAAQVAAEEAFWASLDSACPELRGVWAHPWAEPSWDEALSRLAEANFNLVFPYVASAGVAYYDSALLPRAEVAADCDFLAEALAAGRRHGLAVHPRILAWETLFASAASRQNLRDQGRLAQDSQGKTSDWLCPTDPRNHALLLGLVEELAVRYQVSGIQLDYFRYSGLDRCLCPDCRFHFEQDTGYRAESWPAEVLTGVGRERFLQWRRDVLTDLLRQVRERLREVAPDCQLSVAVFPNWETHPRAVGQDPVRWAREGLVDFLCPMTYTADMERFERLTQYQRTALGPDFPLAAGIGAFSDACRFEDPLDLARQLEAARRAGSQGFVIFNYNETLASDFLPYLAKGLTREPCSEGRAAGQLDLGDSIPVAGAAAGLEADNLPSGALETLD
jgi:uncharacterized lipoprotein YddW (UPF0748 family)